MQATGGGAVSSFPASSTIKNTQTLLTIQTSNVWLDCQSSVELGLAWHCRLRAFRGHGSPALFQSFDPAARASEAMAIASGPAAAASTAA